MPINTEIIDKIAELAKLAFNEEAKKEINTDLNKMLGFVSKLQNLNTDNIKPLVYMLDEQPVLRKDEIKGHSSQEKALKNAPQKDSDYFKVPKVIKK